VKERVLIDDDFQYIRRIAGYQKVRAEEKKNSTHT
jgi:hypothetical protein